MGSLFANEVCLNEDELADLKERCDFALGTNEEVLVKMNDDGTILGIVVIHEDEPAYIEYSKEMSETIREVKQYE